ncbi:hypothetical protein ACUN7V_06265 [Quadrisphaera oryzae]|uniref:hypothetical protein n=1 Tax=Quadrisphaera TaxID=317661 RepID=UPI001649628E|nr:hypothetical protein [Quadrisphaera sp. RL12-1S]MBC3761584.1 hypothetical protein [Quadrisphaera sp. RL12-1S]
MTRPARTAPRPLSRRRRPLVAAAMAGGALLVGGLLAGCSGGQAPQGGATASAAAAPAAPSSSGPAPSGSPTSTVVTSMTTFRSPTGNISCYLSPVQGADPYARCDLVTQQWPASEPPGGCAGTWGGGGGKFGSVGVGGGDAAPLCVGDTIADKTAPTLEWGSSITLEPLTCKSDKNTGMTCENAKTQHGFTVSIQKMSLY